MDTLELVRLSDRNLVAFGRAMYGPAQDGEIAERDGLMLYAGATRFPAPFNGAILTGEPEGALSPEEILARAETFFAERRRRFLVWIRAHADEPLERAARERGYLEIDDTPGMVVERRVAPGAVPAVRRVADAAGVRDFAEVCARGYATYGLRPDAVHASFARPDICLRPDAAAFVAYDGGAPVSAAMVIADGRAAGLYWVATVPEARGRGLGTACTAAATNAGFDLGAPVVVLQASSMGEPIYRRLGYREVTRYRWLISPESA